MNFNVLNNYFLLGFSLRASDLKRKCFLLVKNKAFEL